MIQPTHHLCSPANTINYVLLPVKYANQIWKDLCIPVLVTNIPARLGDGFLRNLLEKGLRAVWSSTQLAIFCTVLHFQTQTVDSTLHIRTPSQLLPCGTHAFLEHLNPNPSCHLEKLSAIASWSKNDVVMSGCRTILVWNAPWLLSEQRGFEVLFSSWVLFTECSVHAFH